MDQLFQPNLLRVDMWMTVAAGLLGIGSKYVIELGDIVIDELNENLRQCQQQELEDCVVPPAAGPALHPWLSLRLILQIVWCLIFAVECPRLVFLGLRGCGFSSRGLVHGTFVYDVRRVTSRHGYRRLESVIWQLEYVGKFGLSCCAKLVFALIGGWFAYFISPF